MSTVPDADRGPQPGEESGQVSWLAGWRARFSAQPMWGDALVMLLVSPLTVVAQASAEARTVTGPLSLVWALLFTVPLLWRRTAPDLVGALVVAACLVQLGVETAFVPGDLVVPLVIYALARYGRRGWQRRWLVVALLGAVVAGVDWGWAENIVVRGWPARITRMVAWSIACAAVVLASWFLGQWRRQRDLTLTTLRERAAALEGERDKAIRLAAEEERSRIAREMHDVVAHSLSVIVVQSDGAGYLAEHAEIGDAEARLAQVSRAIATINQTAREALGETRRLVGVLRHQGEDAEMAPHATLDQIANLVQRLDEAGFPASFTMVGRADAHAPLAPGAEMALHRVAQEALTNVMKHAGPGASVQVTLGHDAQGVDLRITDTGRGPGASDGAGHGLVGMRERMAAWGGTVEAHGLARGGFEVHAWMPAEPADAGDGDRGRREISSAGGPAPGIIPVEAGRADAEGQASAVIGETGTPAPDVAADGGAELVGVDTDGRTPHPTDSWEDPRD